MLPLRTEIFSRGASRHVWSLPHYVIKDRKKKETFAPFPLYTALAALVDTRPLL